MASFAIAANTLTVTALNAALAAFRDAMLNSISDQLDVDAIEIEGMPVFVKSEEPKKTRTKKPAAEKAPKPPIQLPWDPIAATKETTRCNALCAAAGLYSQCPKTKSDNSLFCASCAKHGAKYGTIRERLACAPLDFVPPNGGKLKYYANVVGIGGANPKHTPEEVTALLEQCGIRHQDWHYIREPSKRKAKTSTVKADATPPPDTNSGIVATVMNMIGVSTTPPIPPPATNDCDFADDESENSDEDDDDDDDNCQECSGSTTTCTKCPSGAVLSSGTCISECPT